MATMVTKEIEQYRQTLVRILGNCDRRPLATDEPVLHPDVNDLAAFNHARYISDVKDEIHLSICEATRRALARLEDGEYGDCVDCGETISPKRLAAVPWAECCVECQSERENGLPLKKAA
jgi:RNA polymerase-binding transcription factor DksA